MVNFLCFHTDRRSSYMMRSTDGTLMASRSACSQFQVLEPLEVLPENMPNLAQTQDFGQSARPISPLVECPLLVVKQTPPRRCPLNDIVTRDLLSERGSCAATPAAAHQ